MNNPVVVVGSYAFATALYVFFHFRFINSNRLVESNNTLAYVVSFSMFFLIPSVGMIHLAFLILDGEAFRNIITRSLFVGVVGPLLLHLLISRSADGESAMGYVLVPVAYLAFFVIGFIILFIYQFVVGSSAG